MGWTTKLGFTRKDIIAHVTRGWEDRSGGVVSSGRYLDHKVVGNIVWAVLELTTAEGAVEIQSRFITATRIGTEKIDGKLHWGFSDGGYEGDVLHWDHCPLRFLEMVPEVDARWRARVRLYHADRQSGQRKSNPMKVGTVMSFPMTDPQPGKLMCPFCGAEMATLPYTKHVTGAAEQRAARHFQSCPSAAYVRVEVPGVWEITIWMMLDMFVAATVSVEDSTYVYWRREDFLANMGWFHLLDRMDKYVAAVEGEGMALSFDPAAVRQQYDEIVAMMDDMPDFKGVPA